MHSGAHDRAALDPQWSAFGRNFQFISETIAAARLAQAIAMGDAGSIAGQVSSSHWLHQIFGAPLSVIGRGGNIGC
jgi:hypothetical protein